MWQLKMFKNSGGSGIGRVEDEVNQWIKDMKPTVRAVETNMCSVQDSPEGEMFQYIVISVWYDG